MDDRGRVAIDADRDPITDGRALLVTQIVTQATRQLGTLGRDARDRELGTEDGRDASGKERSERFEIRREWAEAQGFERGHAKTPRRRLVAMDHLQRGAATDAKRLSSDAGGDVRDQ